MTVIKTIRVTLAISLHADTTKTGRPGNVLVREAAIWSKLGRLPPPLMIYLGEICSLLCALFWAMAVILFRISLKREVEPFALNLYKNAVALGCFAISLGFIHNPFDGIGREAGLVLVISGILGIAIADTLFLAALHHLGASRNAILNCLYSPFVLLIAMLALGERINLRQGFGFMLVLSGVALAVWQPAPSGGPARPLPTSNLWKGLLEGSSSMLLMAIAIILAKPVLEQSSPVGVAFIRLLSATVGGLLWIALSGRWSLTARAFHRDLPYWKMTLGSVLGTYLALLIWLVGYKYAKASIAAVLNQTSVFWVMLLAAWLLREKITWRQMAGACLGFSGVACIFLAGV